MYIFGLAFLHVHGVICCLLLMTLVCVRVVLFVCGMAGVCASGVSCVYFGATHENVRHVFSLKRHACMFVRQRVNVFGVTRVNVCGVVRVCFGGDTGVSIVGAVIFEPMSIC